jgi:hypothetical protein
MVVPAYDDIFEHLDLSIRCECPVCDHPAVVPDRHLREPPQRVPWTSS